MNKLLSVILFGLLFFSFSINAQRNCGTMDHLHERIEQNPEIQKNLDRLEQFTKNFQIDNEAKELSGGIITIPVVVHVVYRTNAENVSDAQIQSQIDVLNEDFRTAGTSWAQAADSEIEFCLTKTTRTPTSVSSHGTNDSVKSNSTGGKNVENPESSLNMWVCNIGGSILGYAQFPGDAPATDGVVIDYRYFGTTGTATAPFDLGRTTTHEVGHWLNLRHIWGDGGCNVDDFVNDTPSAGGPNYTSAPCTAAPNSCKPKGKPGQPDDPDMFQNYMDYSDDACMDLFTSGQKDRMWAAINASRPGLLTGACDGTPPPPPTPEICDNGVDDDGDGQVDCADGDCSGDPNCDTPPPPPAGCDAPTGLSHSRAKGGREGRLSWNSMSSANSYDVEVFNASGTLIASGTITGTSATVSGLTKNASYSWRVRANCGSSASDWSTATFNARLAQIISEEITISPNPASYQTWLTWDIATKEKVVRVFDTEELSQSANEYSVQLISASGQILNTKKTLDTSIVLDLSRTNAGVYIVRIQDNEGNSAIKKLMVK